MKDFRNLHSADANTNNPQVKKPTILSFVQKNEAVDSKSVFNNNIHTENKIGLACI
jgi:hypothetical protein